jgi:hypothetical protein
VGETDHDDPESLPVPLFFRPGRLEGDAVLLGEVEAATIRLFPAWEAVPWIINARPTALTP